MNIGTEVLEKLCARHIIAARVEQSVVVDRPPRREGRASSGCRSSEAPRRSQTRSTGTASPVRPGTRKEGTSDTPRAPLDPRRRMPRNGREPETHA